MSERILGLTSEGQSLQETHHAEQAFLREWGQPEAQKRKTASQQGYSFHSERGVRAVKQMLEPRQERYQNETKHEVILCQVSTVQE